MNVKIFLIIIGFFMIDDVKNLVTPNLDCTHNMNNICRSIWGYVNDENVSVNLNLSDINKFEPGTENRGQPTTFDKGYNKGILFTERNCTSEPILTWKLNGGSATSSPFVSNCRKVLILLDCVYRINDTLWVAFFDSYNENNFEIPIPLGIHNKIAVSNSSGLNDLFVNPPQIFPVGTQKNIYTLFFNPISEIVWYVDSPDFFINYLYISTKSPKCPDFYLNLTEYENITNNSSTETSNLESETTTISNPSQNQQQTTQGILGEATGISEATGNFYNQTSSDTNETEINNGNVESVTGATGNGSFDNSSITGINDIEKYSTGKIPITNTTEITTSQNTKLQTTSIPYSKEPTIDSIPNTPLDFSPNPNCIAEKNCTSKKNKNAACCLHNNCRFFGGAICKPNSDFIEKRSTDTQCVSGYCGKISSDNARCCLSNNYDECCKDEECVDNILTDTLSKEICKENICQLQNKTTCSKLGESCNENGKCCDHVCTNIQIDSDNCGMCGLKCSCSSCCAKGFCKLPIGSICSLNIECASDNCQNGMCILPITIDGNCCSDNDCIQGQFCLNRLCVFNNDLKFVSSQSRENFQGHSGSFGWGSYANNANYERNCSNKLDDDKNGFSDCSDDNCKFTTSCAVSSPINAIPIINGLLWGIFVFCICSSVFLFMYVLVVPQLLKKKAKRSKNSIEKKRKKTKLPSTFRN